MEFATAALHNSFYFNKLDNKIEGKYTVSRELEKLVNELLASGSPKKWLRAYFNHGLINYIQGGRRLLPCEMGKNGFFMDPCGRVLPCNGSVRSLVMGSIREKSWEEVWNSPQANKIREQVRDCNRNCWMIGSAAPAIKNHPFSPLLWVLQHKFGKKYRYYPDRSGSKEVEDPA
jgi:MoaA/NifB/PqqE/SkfB family radical SAM enzyme